MRELRQDKIVEYNCAAQKLFVPFLLQIPVWITVSMALRRLAWGMEDEPESSTPRLEGEEGAVAVEPVSRVEQLASEGLPGWAVDLTAPDPTLALPLLVGALYLANTALHANNHPVGQERTKMVKVKK